MEETTTDIAARLAMLEQKLDAVMAKVSEVRQLVGPYSSLFPDGSMLTQTIHNLKYFIDPDDLIIAPQMVIYRQWEADVSEVFHHLCGPETVVVDVGANFGYFSVLSANIIGNQGSGRVFAFEPNPKLAELLRRNIEINWSIAPVTFHQAAVADTPGELTLYVPKGHGANASLSPPEGIESVAVTVPAVCLDDVLPPDLIVDVMKIDVEGHELSVLKGAHGVIGRSPGIHLIMEWSRKQMQQAGIDPAAVLAELEGFTPHPIELGKAPLANPQTMEWLLAQDYIDVLFVRT
ncbi:FkbM family methyltransferase [Novosphingobium sp.]|uniref:FkbM family methyltransferase n=1 Tax=Novosphingobium sp. TaxID=1874826 RepID=UPI003BAA51D8